MINTKIGRDSIVLYHTKIGRDSIVLYHTFWQCLAPQLLQGINMIKAHDKHHEKL